MAIKKIGYDKINKTVCGITFDTELQAKTHLPGSGAADECDSNWVILDFDHDPTVDYLTALELNADGTALVNPFAGKTIDEQVALVEKRDSDTKIKKLKGQLKHQVKIIAKDKIQELKWKIDRAKDIDALNGNNDALRAAYQSREDIRVKSNAADTAIEALATLDEVYAYDPKKAF